jgi:hypothetical protein
MHGHHQIISTGRDGQGNIRTPSPDHTGSTGAFPARPDVRGRSYDREIIAMIDEAHSMVGKIFVVVSERDLVN